jgi:hypothetical protein
LDLAEHQAELRREWRGITADSQQVHVRAFDYVLKGLAANEAAIASDLVEVFKYALKFSEMSLADCWNAAQLLHGRRLVGSAGALYGVPEPEDLLDDQVQEDEPFVQLLYRHVAGGWGGGGYELAQGLGVMS